MQHWNVLVQRRASPRQDMKVLVFVIHHTLIKTAIIVYGYAWQSTGTNSVDNLRIYSQEYKVQ